MVGTASGASKASRFASSSGSTGQCRRTVGQSPPVLMVGTASGASKASRFASSSGSTGQCRRTVGQSPPILMVGTASGASKASGQLEEGAPHFCERLLEVEQPLSFGGGELTPEVAFAKPQQELPRRPLVDAVGRSARVELREKRRGALAIVLALVEEQLPELAVERRVEVLGPEIGED